MSVDHKRGIPLTRRQLLIGGGAAAGVATIAGGWAFFDWVTRPPTEEELAAARVQKDKFKADVIEKFAGIEPKSERFLTDSGEIGRSTLGADPKRLSDRRVDVRFSGILTNALVEINIVIPEVFNQAEADRNNRERVTYLVNPAEGAPVSGLVINGVRPKEQPLSSVRRELVEPDYKVITTGAEVNWAQSRSLQANGIDVYVANLLPSRVGEKNIQPVALYKLRPQPKTPLFSGV